MKTLFCCLAAVAAMSASLAGHAATMRMDVSFDATNFTLQGGDPVAPPVSQIVGSFSLVFDTDDVNTPFGDITATPTTLDLNINGKEWTPAETELLVVFDFGSTVFDETTFFALDFGGLLNGTGGVNGNTDDFFLSFGAGDFMTYAVSGLNAGFGSSDIQTNITFSEVAPVPLPAAGLLMIAGLGALGATRVRRRAD